MKKLVFMFVAVAAISFASCGGNTQAPAEAETIEQEVEDEDTTTAVVDSAATDSTVAAEEPAAE